MRVSDGFCYSTPTPIMWWLPLVEMLFFVVFSMFVCVCVFARIPYYLYLSMCLCVYPFPILVFLSYLFFSCCSIPSPPLSSPLLIFPLLSLPNCVLACQAVDKQFCWICHSHLASICVFFFVFFSWWGDWQRGQTLAFPHPGIETLTGGSSQP